MSDNLRKSIAPQVSLSANGLYCCRNAGTRTASVHIGLGSDGYGHLAIRLAAGGRELHQVDAAVCEHMGRLFLDCAAAIRGHAAAGGEPEPDISAPLPGIAEQRAAEEAAQ